MYHVIRIGHLQSPDGLFPTANVNPEIVNEVFPEAGSLKNTPSKRVQAEARYLMPLRLQEESEPCPLKASVPRDEVMSPD